MNCQREIYLLVLRSLPASRTAPVPPVKLNDTVSASNSPFRAKNNFFSLSKKGGKRGAGEGGRECGIFSSSRGRRTQTCVKMSRRCRKFRFRGFRGFIKESSSDSVPEWRIQITRGATFSPEKARSRALHAPVVVGTLYGCTGPRKFDDRFHYCSGLDFFTFQFSRRK